MSGAFKALDEAETLSSCLQAVADLLTPDLPLESDQRGNLALLLDLLLRQQNAAIARARSEVAAAGVMP